MKLLQIYSCVEITISNIYSVLITIVWYLIAKSNWGIYCIVYFWECRSYLSTVRLWFS